LKHGKKKEVENEAETQKRKEKKKREKKQHLNMTDHALKGGQDLRGRW